MGEYINHRQKGKVLVCGILLFCLLAGCGKAKEEQGIPAEAITGEGTIGVPALTGGAGQDSDAGDVAQGEQNPAGGDSHSGSQDAMAGNAPSKGQDALPGNAQQGGQNSAAGNAQQGGQDSAAENSQTGGQASDVGNPQSTTQGSSAENPSTTGAQQTMNENDFVIANGILMRYNGTAETVIVPDGVKSIDEKAFLNNTTLVHMILPDGVVEIGEDAFGNCRHLEKIELPETVKKIGNRAFSNCYALKDIDLQHVEELGTYAFQKCHMITAVCLPKLKRLGMGAFYEAGVETVSGMEMLEEGGGNAFSETPFWENYNETSGGELFICNHILLFGRGCSKRLEIPEGVTQIAPGAFSQERWINVVVIPESMEEIGAYAFDESYVPETVYMPAKDVRLGSRVFGRKGQLRTIHLVSDGVLQEGNGDFLVAGTTLLDYRGEDVDVIIPDNVKIIGEEAFGANADIVSVSIPEGVTEIGENAFSGCGSLQNVSMPSTLTTIRYGAFGFCPALENIDLRYVQEIGEDAFCVCTQLRDIELSSIKSIGTEAFANSGILHVGGMEGLTEYGSRIFAGTPLFGENTMHIAGGILFDGKGCTGDITIPDGVRMIAREAFSGTQITSATCPDTLREIGEGAFRGCLGLQKFSMGDGVISLGEYAFYEDTNLSDLCLSAKLNALPETALMGCERLQMLTIPEGCEVNMLCFEWPGSSKERGTRLITVAPTQEVPGFLRDSFSQTYRIYTTELPDGTEWMDTAGRFGWSLSLLELAETEVTLKVGEEFPLIFNSGAKADWHTEDAQVVRVDSDGRLYAKGAGQTDVVAVVYGKEYRCRVVVE